MNVLKKLFYKYFWKDIYYNTKWSLWGIIKYFNITRKMRPWDYSHILIMFQFQLKILKYQIENGSESFETKLLKLKDIQRAIDLIQHKLDNNYINRLPIKPSWYVYDDKFHSYRERSPEEIKMDSDIIDISIKLEQDEWNELWEIIKVGKHFDQGINSWWES